MTEPIDWADLDSGQEPDDPWAPPARKVEVSQTPVPATPASDQACQDRRAAVLAHPDLAARLCEPPLRYARPEQWNGYIPPEMWGGRPNDSTRRLQLLGIVAELEGREA